jgi:hypothetical protein
MILPFIPDKKNHQLIIPCPEVNISNPWFAGVPRLSNPNKG